MIYLRNLFVSLDQLLNTIFGGDPDLTISARIGFFSLVNQGSSAQGIFYPPEGRCKKYYWIVHEKIANWAWSPTDGPSHCRDAYEADKYEDYRSKNWWIFLVLMSILVIILSVIIGVFLRLFSIFS